ncbi:DUF932 domain-containing protein [Spirosoma flavum]|uniref:DUF932 domain-containing protein n=1 Tax=Spirosoma flavum TaxID=2048557 RepID=A0ABW6ANL2_9BACT
MTQSELFPRTHTRKTDLNTLLFPVALEPIYLAGATTPVDNFKAIAGFPHDLGYKTVFCVVTDNYQLLTNSDALTIAESVYRRVFKTVDMKAMEVFNLIYPETKSFCHIDIIDKNYEVNLWAEEVYLPFIRVTNSYNRTRKLIFELGFCRKLCDNGVIFEKETITFAYTHTKGLLNIDAIEKQLANDDRLSRLETSFIAWMQQLKNYPVADKYVLALCARIMEVHFDINNQDLKKRKKETDRAVLFQDDIERLKKKYWSEMGQTAYTVFNMATDYATHSTNTLHIDGQQARVGTWLGDFCKAAAAKPFSMDDYLNDYRYLLN